MLPSMSNCKKKFIPNLKVTRFLFNSAGVNIIHIVSPLNTSRKNHALPLKTVSSDFYRALTLHSKSEQIIDHELYE